MDLGYVLSIAIVFLGLITTLIGVIWKMLNNKITDLRIDRDRGKDQCNHKHLQLSSELEKYVTKELYNREITTIMNDIKELKEELKDFSKTMHIIANDVSVIKHNVEKWRVQ